MYETYFANFTTDQQFLQQFLTVYILLIRIHSYNVISIFLYGLFLPYKGIIDCCIEHTQLYRVQLKLLRGS